MCTHLFIALHGFTVVAVAVLRSAFVPFLNHGNSYNHVDLIRMCAVHKHKCIHINKNSFEAVNVLISIELVTSAEQQEWAQNL